MERRSLPPLDRLIACPTCDVLHEIVDLAEGERARCRRCHTVLMAQRRDTFVNVMLLSVTVAILMAGAVFFPFLNVSVAGLSNRSSIFSTALAFSEGVLAPLALAVMLLVVLIPIVRAAALVYTLAPLARGRRPYRHADGVFRFAEALKPWSMAEIFVIGTAVALVKVADVATIGVGPAFWALAALVAVLILQNIYLSKWTIWEALEPR